MKELPQACPNCEISEDPGEIDVVVASFDRGFDYHKLAIGFKALRGGARFLATNVDATCPLPDDELPDAAAVIGALEASTGRKLEMNVGKPSPLMLEAALEHLATPPEATLLVGDRLDTDILMGQNAGMTSVLVLTGVTSPLDLIDASIQPNHVLGSIAELPGLLRSWQA